MIKIEEQLFQRTEIKPLFKVGDIVKPKYDEQLTSTEERWKITKVSDTFDKMNGFIYYIKPYNEKAKEVLNSEEYEGESELEFSGFDHDPNQQQFELVSLKESIDYDDVFGDLSKVLSEDELDNFLYDLAEKMYPDYSDDEVSDISDRLYDELYDKKLIKIYDFDNQTGVPLSFICDKEEVMKDKLGKVDKSLIW